MRREFDLSFKQDIIDGKVKVVTKDNRPVEILKWNRIDDEGRHIIALIHHSDECEDVYHFYEDGRCDDMYGNDAYNLYVITDETESEDERIRKEIIEFVKSRGGFKQEYIAWLEKQGEQKPAEWSDEDERCRKALLHLLEHYAILTSERESCIVWLKSLRPNHWKPSDEQMRVLDLAIRCGINRGTTEETTLVSLFNDLKKLKG